MKRGTGLRAAAQGVHDPGPGFAVCETVLALMNRV